MNSKINFETTPEIYKHWELLIEKNKAFLIMKVDENAGFFEGYKLKLNSYDEFRRFAKSKVFDKTKHYELSAISVCRKTK